MNFFDTILSYFETIWQFVSNMFQALITLCNSLVSAVELPLYLVNLAPSFLAASISAVSGIAVLKLVLGREQG